MNEAIQPTTRDIRTQRAIALVQLLLFGPLSLLTTVLSMVACFSCILCPSAWGLGNVQPAQVFGTMMTVFGFCWMFLLGIMPFSVAACCILAVLGLLYYPLYAVRRYEHFLNAPSVQTDIPNVMSVIAG